MNLSDIKQFLVAKINRRQFKILGVFPLKISFAFYGVPVILIGNDCIGLMEQTFFEGYSNDLSVKGKYVIDVGASIGDTAILFALKGAKKVIAVEPMKSHAFMRMNILANHLEGIITPLDYAIGKELTTLNIKEGAAVSSDKIVPGTDRVCQIIPLTYMTGYLPRDAVVKMDCEGCEFDAILFSSKSTLRYFSAFLIEIHGDPKKILWKFKGCGFSCTRTRHGSYLFMRVKS